MMSETNTLTAIATPYQLLPNGGLMPHDLKEKKPNQTGFGLPQSPQSLQNGTILKARKENSNSSTKLAANATRKSMEELSEQELDCETPGDDYGVESKHDEIVSWDGSDVSDIENFEGEIVYRPDGSAFLIDNSELLDYSEKLADNESEGKNIKENHTSRPQIVNALHIPAYMTMRNLAQFEADLTTQYSNPVVHSFRVYDMRQKNENNSEENDSEKYNCELDTKNTDRNNHHGETLEGHVKPILMCFLCKLSFGNSKSFLTHATSEHRLELNELERKVMARKNQSAIIQGHGKEKSALLSFLELKSTENPAPWINSSKPHSETNFFPSLFPIQTMNYKYPTTSSTSTKVVESSCNDTSPSHEVNNKEEHERHSTENVGDAEYEEHLKNDSSPGADSNHSTPVCNSNESEIESTPSEVNSSDRTLPKQVEQSCEKSALEKAEEESQNVCDFKVHTSDANEICQADGASDDNKDGAPTRQQSTPSDTRPDSCEGTSNFVFTESPISVTSNPDSDIHMCPSEGNSQVIHISSSVECPKCDMVLGSSRSLGGHMTMMHSRNSCKTLKCPKCNWHYKYQQTLEAHMKEKHPETETKCVYCETNQPHPRLSRGETYTCGYKPYRCDICNYSTTTKGNLSIHNQSDKHLNNLKELQNGGDHLYLQTNIDVPGGTKPKPKQTWRCDVCDYETNVARNLRIHMTSEKHMHNMLAIQQNVSQMQREMTKFGPFQSEESVYAAYMTQQLMPMISPDGTAVDMQNLMAQYAYDPAAYAALVNGMQMMPPQQQQQQQEEFMDDSTSESDDPSKNQPLYQYHCSVCNKFGTDNLKELQVHLQRDRNQPCEDLWRLVIGDLQQCVLCNYSTHLKANFQLHTKTDKHMQKLQLFNHIREGGKQNEWRLKYLNVGNPTQVRCNACDFYTYSVEKLGAHSQPGNYRHESNMKMFRRLQQVKITVNSVSKRFHCTLCNYSTKSKMNLMQHIQSLQHLRKEQEIDDDDDDPPSAITPTSPSSAEGALDLSKKDKPSPTGIDSKDKSEESQTRSQSVEVEDHNSNTNQIYNCMYCKYSSIDQQRIAAHVLSQHSIKPPALLRCPLCQEICTNKINLEVHLMESHSVSRECIQRLISTLDYNEYGTAVGSAPPQSGSQSQIVPETASTDAVDRPPSHSRESPCSEDSGDAYRCQKCHLKFANIDLLYSHQNDTCPLTEQDTPGGPGFLCWKKGCNQYFKTASVLQMHFKEIHAKKHQLQQNYKFYCSQCNQSFPTEDRLELHAEQHLLKEATICSICQQNFHTLTALRKHLENDHLELSKGDLLKFVNALSDAEKFSSSAEEAQEAEADDTAPESPRLEGSSSIDSIFASWNEAAEKPTDESYTDPNKKFKCHRCHYGFRLQTELSAHNKTLLHRRGDRIPYTLPVVDKFNNPNRPFKCDVCRESFTQKSILLVHLNSVSHLHKLNKTLSNEPEAEPIPEPKDEKPFKCEVCNVAYSQSTTLDIHVRSVLHKRNTTKQAESIASINNNEHIKKPPTPTVEQQQQPSNAEKAMEKMQERLEAEQEKVREAEEKTEQQYQQEVHQQHRKLKQLHHQSAKDDLRAHFADAQVQAQAMANMAAAMMLHNPLLPQQNLYCCDKCTSVFVSQEALLKHQQMSCYAVEEPEPLSPSQLSQKMMDPTLMLRRRRSAIQRRLLEGYGYDLVQQFNESAQGLPASIATKDKFSCVDCKKEFSSVWVYKAHVEEVHRSLLPSDDVEMYSQDYRKEEYVMALAAENETKPKVEQTSVKQEKESDKPSGTGQPLPGITPQQLNSKDQALQKQASQSQQEQSQHLQAQMTAQALSAQAMASQQMFMANSFPFGMVPPMQAMLPGMQAVYPVPAMPHMQPIQYLDPNYMQKSPKRARTRISDDQLKILRAYFDINNSPSEDQIQEMSQKSCLPHKVIKHWFRNTLFKERQRNKDSPYNFNNPPTTSLLEPPDSPIIKQEPMKPLGLTTADMIPSSSYVPRSLSMKLPSESSVSFAPPHTSRSTILSTTSEISISPATSPTMMSPMLSSPTFTSPLTSPCVPSGSAPQSPSGSGSRRAGRTRFTDYQVKILQDFFESNAYPKDDDLEHLSRMLNLSPRVIVVWFQNARQKARKVFENQPAPEGEGDGDGVRYKRTPGLNYQCNKCFLVFQRFYELIRHQKSQCFKEDSGMESASESSPSGQDLSTNKHSNKRHASTSSVASDLPTPKEKQPKLNSESRDSRDIRDARDNRDTRDIRDIRDTRDVRDTGDTIKSEEKSSRSSSSGPVVHYQCEKCSMVFPHFEQWQEHQQVHMMGMNIFGSYMQPQLSYNMMYMPYEQGMTPEQYFNYITGKELAAKSPSKRKHSEASDEASGSTSSDPSSEMNSSSADQPRDKRLRTTISAAQLDVLYCKYQEDSNPTRRMLDLISKEVGLKKRVVQVWFQNTRARERKGQFRMSAPNNIHRRCPFCKALFKLKSALEGHIKIHHSDQQLTPGAIDSILAQSPSQISPGPINDGEQAMNLCMNKSLSRDGDISDEGSKYDVSKDKSESVSLGSSKYKYGSLVVKTNGSVEVDEDIDYNMDDDDLATIATKDSDLMSPVGSMLGDEIVETTPSEAGSVGRSEDSISMADETDSQKSKDFAKRYRTQINPSQLRVLKHCYGDYRTPTMHECELLGREVGLPKRVVQVWFQNARAKEKKIKTNFTKQIGLMSSGDGEEGSCKLCNVKYSLNMSIRDHIFTEVHIRNIRRKVSKDVPETDTYAGESSLVDHASAQSLMANHQAALMQQSMLSPMAAAQMQAMQQAMSAQMMSPQLQQQMMLAAQNEAVSKIKKESGVDEKGEGRSPSASSASGAAAVAEQMNMAVARNDAALVQYLYGTFAPYYAQMPFMYPAMYAMGGNEAFYPYDPSTMQGAIPPQLLQSYGGLAAAQGSQNSSPKPEKTASKLPSSSSSSPPSSSSSSKQETKFSKDKEGLILRPKSSTNRYLCKKCERVFTDRDSVTSHQVTACYMGQVVNIEQTVEKLPSNRFLCQACPREALITEEDAIKHLESSGHRNQVEHHLKTKTSTSSENDE